MKKPELLAPAGNMESLKAAIAAGCDAIYLGGYLFGARSFAGNFSNEELEEVVRYAHLYHVKIYVTTNTLVYENEVETFLNYIDFLYRINVDAVIIQDLGMMDLVRKLYPDFEVHASTQMHVHNLEGVKLVQALGLTRAVLARETPIEEIKKIKEKTNIELEIFVHGALCISYSGQCFMSSLIGNRSGNRGTCAQSCRKKYQLLEKIGNNFETITDQAYLLSTKDLNTLEHLGELIEAGVDSFKVEGRMKRPEYVYLVISIYRRAIDSYLETGKVMIDDTDLLELKKIFNRGFTKGFLFHENEDQFTNTFRPNHMGMEIGKVVSVDKNFVTIELTDTVRLGDGIRILGQEEDTGCTLNVFKRHQTIVKEAVRGDLITLEIKGSVTPGSKVLKTTDQKQLEAINNLIEKKKRKIKIMGELHIHRDKEMMLKLQLDDTVVQVTSTYVPEVAHNLPTTRDRVLAQIHKLGNTPYEFEELTLEMDDDLFISIKEVNELRRNAITQFMEKDLLRTHIGRQSYDIDVPDFKEEQKRTCFIHSEVEYERVHMQEWDMIYAEEPLYSKIKGDPRVILKLPRIMLEHPYFDGPLLVGELGSISVYSNPITDFSFHPTNSYTVAFLHHMGVKKVTLSYEIGKEQIKELIDAYVLRYQKRPNLELIVDSNLEAMITKYNLFSVYKKEGSFLYLKDQFQNLYPLEDKKDYMIIYHYERRTYEHPEEYYKIGIHSLRYEY